ncbi:VPS33 [[Candida] subhashii]|uniref:VPS33 n=1 Tax=[Candida] subhashii TaxID=561895 RepID=A0A8J5QNV5_9ASCO|nr:VPS33 [[Candida] subhashii]KAG7663941.1 VPS33 [[Candida] subhashii]
MTNVEAAGDGYNLNEFNESTLQNLLTQLSKVYSTSNNLLILDPLLSPLLNQLTQFQRLKDAGKFQNIVWLNEGISDIQLNVFSKYSSLIILIPCCSIDKNFQLLTKFIHSIINHIHGLKINIIVKDLEKSLVYLLNDEFKGILNFQSILKQDPKLIKPFNITSRIKVSNWATYPIYTDGILLNEVNQFSGIDDYFQQPLKQVNQLTSNLIQVLFSGLKRRHLLKLRNVYGKGNHSDLLITQLLECKIPEYLNENLSQLEIEFYQEKLHSNTDLIVLERNIDFTPVIFNQLNYHGLIDDLFDIRFDSIKNFPEEVDINKTLNQDELYNQDLKHLNFSLIGSRLNKLAKFIQQQFKDRSGTNDTTLSDMKQLVSNLGNLTMQQDLIKKHTAIGESILSNIKYEYETFLNFQNDIFEMDYKLQLSKLKYFFNCNYPKEFIYATILLIGYINDGISNRDLDWISAELQDNYGISASFALERMIELKLIRVIQDSGSDFLSTLGLTTQKKQQPPPHLGPVGASGQGTSEENYQVGISGGQDTFKSNYTLINKFWNLHPLEEEEEQEEQNETQQESTNLVELYPNPSFTLPGNTVPLIYRLVESLYFRDFLKYKPINNLKRRPNWDNLGLNTMFAGKTVDINLDDHSDDKNRDGITPNGNIGTTNNKSSIPNPDYIIIVIIGGITRSEITCFKYLQEKFKKQGKDKEIIILSNGIVNNTRLWQFIDSA